MGAAHWESRASQRGISREAIDLVMKYGDSLHDHRGAEILYLSKRARRRLSRHESEAAARLDTAGNVYLVIADGRFVTVGHRYKRLRRP